MPDWASEFAPPSQQKFISYIAGWMSTLSWQCGTCSGMFLLGVQIQGLIALTNESYSPQPWQGYLFVILMVTIGLLLNTWGAKQLPLIEGIILVSQCSCGGSRRAAFRRWSLGLKFIPRWLTSSSQVFHILGWATVLIVLWILSPKNSANTVFTSFQNEGGWSTMGLSMLVGQVTSIYGLIGSDGAA